MTISDLLPKSAVLELEGTTAEAALAELCRPFTQAAAIDGDAILSALAAREALGSTAVGDGFAIPHGRVPGLPNLMASFGRSRSGVDFKALDGRPVHFFFTLAIPETAPGPYLIVLAQVSRTFKDPDFREALLDAPDSGAVYRLIKAAAAR